MNGFDKMNKKLLASQVEDALMDDILNKPVPIGEKIPNEYELAEMYGVGRSTIRETVKSLVSKGILEVRQGSGTYVIGTDTLENDPLGFSKYEDKYKLALELFEVRLMLEPEIAALAAQKATEQDKEEIVRLCDEVENLYLAGENASPASFVKRLFIKSLFFIPYFPFHLVLIHPRFIQSQP